jgi:hypothetical protein
MSIKRMTTVWDGSGADGARLLVLLAIADSANDNGLAWPGIETLMQRARLSRRQVIYHIQALEKSGELYAHRRQGRHNYYLVLTGMDEHHRKAAFADLSERVKEAIPDIALVQPIAPVQSTALVQPIAPVPVQPIAPVPVQPIAPDPSLEPSIEPSEGLDLQSGGETQASPPAPLFPSDEPKQPHVAIIDAYHQALIDCQREPLIENWYSRHGKAAKPMVSKGITPQQVYEATCAVYHDAYPEPYYRERSKPIELQKLGEEWAAISKFAERLRPVHLGTVTLEQIRASQQAYAETIMRRAEAGEFEERLK